MTRSRAMEELRPPRCAVADALRRDRPCKHRLGRHTFRGFRPTTTHELVLAERSQPYAHDCSAPCWPASAWTHRGCYRYADAVARGGKLELVKLACARSRWRRPTNAARPSPAGRDKSQVVDPGAAA